MEKEEEKWEEEEEEEEERGCNSTSGGKLRHIKRHPLKRISLHNFFFTRQLENYVKMLSSSDALILKIAVYRRKKKEVRLSSWGGRERETRPPNERNENGRE